MFKSSQFKSLSFFAFSISLFLSYISFSSSMKEYQIDSKTESTPKASFYLVHPIGMQERFLPLYEEGTHNPTLSEHREVLDFSKLPRLQASLISPDFLKANLPNSSPGTSAWKNNEIIYTFPADIWTSKVKVIASIHQKYWRHLENTSATELDLTNYPFSCESLQELFDILARTRITILNCSAFPLDNRILIPKLNELLTRNDCKIEVLHLVRSHLTPSTAKQLLKNFRNSKVHTLNLRDNHLFDSNEAEISVDQAGHKIVKPSIGNIIQALEGSCVRTLVLSANGIKDQGVIEVAKNLKFTSVECLVLINNEIENRGAIGLGENLSGSKVHTIYLPYNEIGDEGAIKLVQSLVKIKAKSINLAYNKITDNGAKMMATCLRNVKAVEINLLGNVISTETQSFLKETYPRIKWIF